MSAGLFHPPGQLTTHELLAATGGQLVAGPADGSWTLCTDSREMEDGAIFVALQGENFDGHGYVPEVLGRWRSGALVRSVSDLPAVTGPVIRVDDTLVALGDIARAFMLRQGPGVVAVTGTVGKTTTRAMLAAIMGQVAPGHCTDGNFNNRIGLPLTLLRLRPEHRWAVLELGMSEPGEIRELARIAEPRVRVITTVSEGHLEFFDDVDGIARAKGELFEDARPGDILVSPHGAWFDHLLPRPPGAISVTFGGPDAAVHASAVEHLALGGTRAVLSLYGEPVDVHIPVPGRHQLHNAMAAALAALHLGADSSQIAAGLASLELPGRRMRVEEIEGVTVVDDAYNANPASIASALATVAEADRAGRLIVVLGDMLELGAEAGRLHAAVGEQAVDSGAELLIGVGPHMKRAVEVARVAGLGALLAEDSEHAGELVAGFVEPGDLLLLKGSRGMRMERVLDALRSGEGS